MSKLFLTVDSFIFLVRMLKSDTVDSFIFLVRMFKSELFKYFVSCYRLEYVWFERNNIIFFGTRDQKRKILKKIVQDIISISSAHGGSFYY